jgi:RNA polymerase sigma-70 factor (ECF subfamily)
MAPRPVLSNRPIRLVQPDEEASLVARCQAGEPAALRALFDRERSRVHALLYRVVGANTHMDDLLQDTFLEVFRSLSGFRGDSSLRTWIDRCAVRVAYAHFERKKRQPLLEPVHDLGSGAPSPEERTSRRDAVRRLYAELDRLDPRQRMAFTLFAVEGRSLREVAEIMDSTVSAAKIRAWRARRALERKAKKDPLLSEFLLDGAQDGAQRDEELDQ